MNKKNGKRQRRRNLKAGAAAAAALAVLTAGCSGGSPEAGGAASQGSGKEPAKLTNVTYWTGMATQVAATMKSYNEIAMYKELEKRTGVKVDFQHPPQGQEKDQFNLMITGGKLPDVIEHYFINDYPGGPEKAIKDGKIIKLNEYIDKYAPNLKKVLDANPEMKKQVTTDEGSIWGFPFLRGDKALQVYQGLAIRKDWLDKLGLQIPTTIDELYTVLKAFKEKDPNGNGKADEIPYLMRAFTPATGELNSSAAILGAYGISYGFYHENGQVKYGPVEPGYKEYLTLMNKWYKEGLLDKDFAATDNKLLDAKITGNQLGVTVMNTGGGIGKYMNLMKGKDPNFKLVAIPYPVLKKGDKQLWGQIDFIFNGKAASISSSNKNIEETVKWLDYGYSEEGHMLMNFGIEGVSYKMENGYPKFTDLVMKNPNGLPVQQAMAQYARSSWDGMFVQDKRYLEQYAELPEQKESLKVWAEPTNERRMPLVTPNREESGKYASIMSDINTYRDEMYSKFIMGVEPLENFDKYVQTLKGMGLEEAVKIQQAALERYNKR
ncbi:extracellular solute-binding protein [Paenibacillus mucilaginosus]|uniref:Extracellular solute-binding protein family 1 n=1 Tax=Paenibacillus mucilaginosus (strain KNP414) TaxID=1036673 RepID=F8F941_PAEMK|nr:extracellular solute-binding protein [Paenibacillus mucilaginosus]AEI42489.1 extracellular solute-binding protein family 1 [Paenibacillus mucilaginosus KNP414]MCG7213883.1 extracellular solute-binding protein [Paenibacillus mucilaginosus]WDM25889.1 extracellular solute-binding protein [Paenibacillus mucilaginosus]